MSKNEFDEFMEQYSDILNMTNKEAADVIKQLLFNSYMGRGSGKTTSFIKYQAAFLKVIKCLEEHPDTATGITNKEAQQHRGLRAMSILGDFKPSDEPIKSKSWQYKNNTQVTKK